MSLGWPVVFAGAWFSVAYFCRVGFSSFLFAMITTARTIIIETSSMIVNDWAGNSGTAGDEEAVGATPVLVLITETVLLDPFAM